MEGPNKVMQPAPKKQGSPSRNRAPHRTAPGLGRNWVDPYRCQDAFPGLVGPYRAMGGRFRAIFPIFQMFRGGPPGPMLFPYPSQVNIVRACSKAAMDKLAAELKKQQTEEVEFKSKCVKNFNGNEKANTREE